uniref:Macaca fascicularis brain cDNA, clone: QorA-10628 n=1 Tax=Macaca fascicularis TaxID=9541 RepID=I7G951_MACFA|nr:unnamed protein product [Macaca fascicularis]
MAPGSFALALGAPLRHPLPPSPSRISSKSREFLTVPLQVGRRLTLPGT